MKASLTLGSHDLLRNASSATGAMVELSLTLGFLFTIECPKKVQKVTLSCGTS